MTNDTIQIRFIVRNAITGGYWDGTPAPASFAATRETALPVDSVELATLRATYDNCESETVELQDEEEDVAPFDISDPFTWGNF